MPRVLQIDRSTKPCYVVASSLVKSRENAYPVVALRIDMEMYLIHRITRSDLMWVL